MQKSPLYGKRVQGFFPRALLFFVMFCNNLPFLNAQLYDKQWISGESSGGLINNFGNVILDIQSEVPPIITIDSLGANFLMHSVVIKDVLGDSLLFYTNGRTFWNKHNQKMSNGDSLAWNPNNPYYEQNGLFSLCTGLCVPTDSSHVFYYFYTDMDTTSIFNATISAKHLLVARVNVLMNELTFKDSIVVTDLLNGSIGATKDSEEGWWIIATERGTNCVYIIHNNNTNISSQKICGNDLFNFHPWNIVNALFTNDGSKLILIGAGNSYEGSGIEIVSFDKNTGTFSSVQKYNLSLMVDSSWVPWSATISPSSRFLYAFCSSVILQFDLCAENVGESMKVVARATGAYLPFPTDFVSGQLALDGKIYVNSGSNNWAYSVIENPDEEGEACNVVQDIIIPVHTGGFGYYPNYRLGIPANCSGVGIQQVDSARVKAYPNPTHNQLWIEYNGIVWEASRSIMLRVHDALGREMYAKNLPVYSGIHKVDVREWSAGLYFYSLEADEKKIGSGRFVKE